ncbi:TonB-dependent receptor plug domain-containing protein [Flavivirga eckloniae]|uniref:Uncharacterized protein n=1 Tax=Flavivirga eckloniae TaxID=1803846 RepID=A0A2K9PRG8_9FLAO|nr:TonB-dependent receptor [Flavivirga eckloniae]AUP79408.1 hypothetical protein C1H87_12090 [Flavivirga eckloniae]
MKLILTVFIIICSLLQAFSQKRASFLYSNTPLNYVIVELEKEFNIKLSFNSKLVENQSVTFQGKGVLLDDVLQFIEEQTGIKFFKVSERYYILKQKNPRDLTTTQRLNEVVINEYFTSGISKKLNGSITLTPSSLGILPGLTEPDVLQSLQLLPGIQSPSETASGLYVRGGTPDQNLILWDGIKMYHSGHFFGMISSFNPYITENVKFYTGGTKARYGSKISSVIDITSSNKIPKKVEGGFGFNMMHSDLYIKIPVAKKIALIASARRSFTDFFESITFKNISKRVFQNTKITDGKRSTQGYQVNHLIERFYFSDYTIKGIIKPNDNNEIVVSNLYTRNELDNEFSSLLNVFISDNIDINNRGTSFSWNHKYSKTFSHAFRSYYSNFDLEYNGSTYEGQVGVISYDTTKKNAVRDIGMSFDTNWEINKKNELGIGYQFTSNEIGYELGYRDLTPTGEFEIESIGNTNLNNNHAFYADYQYKNDDKLIINTGLRTNYMSAFKRLYFEPRLHLDFKIAPHLRFKSSLEKLHQEVSQIVEFQTKDFGLENQVWVLSNRKDIPVLKSFQITSGFSFSKKGWNVDVDGYAKRVDGLTSLTKGFENEENKHFFKGKSDVLGLDVLVKKKIDNYRTCLSYSITDNQFTFEGINGGAPFPGNFDIRHNFTWTHSYLWNNFNFSLGWNLRTGTPYTKAISFLEENNNIEIDYSKTNAYRLPNYSRLDFSTTYKFNFSKNEKWRAKLGLSVLNITGRKNFLGKSYKTINFTANGEKFSVFQEINKSSLGIIPNLSFRLEF